MANVKKILFLIICIIASLQIKADVIYISNQKDFDHITESIKKRLERGSKQLYVVFKSGQYHFKDNHVSIVGWNYPNATIIIIGNGSVFIAAGNEYTNLDDTYKWRDTENSCWINENFVEKSGWSETFQSPSSIEVLDMKSGKCRIKSPITVADYTYTDRYNMSILITKWYLSSTYRVDRIKDSYVYFTASDLKETSYGINADWDYGADGVPVCAAAGSSFVAGFRRL